MKTMNSMHTWDRRLGRQLILSAALFLCCISSAQAQQTVTVYFASGMTGESRAVVEKMSAFLAKAANVRPMIDSIRPFSGSGIYITTVERDTYRKYPAELRSRSKEASYLKIEPGSAYISSNSEIGMQAAMYLYLHRLGFRFYFPDEAWFVIPNLRTIFPNHTELAEPAFKHRSMFVGWGPGSPELQEKFSFWQKANMMGGELYLSNAHAYGALVSENIREFQNNPQYLSKPVRNGLAQRGSVLNYAAPGLVDLTHRWLEARFATYQRRNRNISMQSLEPFDGSNLCTTAACRKIGETSSDQVFWFANEVAKKLKRTNPDKMIGLLAYYDHIDIPKYKLEDNIFVTITNGYNTTFYTIDQLIERWKTKTNNLGIYNYLSVVAGNSGNLPIKSGASSYKTVAANIRKFNKNELQAYQAESTYGWMRVGLSNYVAARMIWDPTLNEEEIVDDFFRKSFPASASFVEPIFKSWEITNIMTDDDLYNWFSNLRKAFAAATDPAELKRLEHLSLYLYYVKLHRDYIESSGEARKKKGLELFAYLWKIQPAGVVASHAALNVFPPQLSADYRISNKNVAWKNMKVSYPEGKRQWLSFIDGYLPGLKRIQVDKQYDKIPFIKSAPTLTAGRKSAPTATAKKNTITFSGSITTLLDNTGAAKGGVLRIKGGKYKKANRVGFDIYAWNDELQPSQLLSSHYFPADSKEYSVDLSKLASGKYILVFSDDGTLGEITFPAQSRFSILASKDQPLLGGASNTFYFYVPEGTKKFYIMKAHLLQVFNGRNQLKKFPEKDKLLEIPVAKGEEGWWRVSLQREQLILIGVPPVIGRDPESLFIP